MLDLHADGKSHKVGQTNYATGKDEAVSIENRVEKGMESGFVIQNEQPDAKDMKDIVLPKQVTHVKITPKEPL